jgi:hypothetical protein
VPDRADHRAGGLGLKPPLVQATMGVAIVILVAIYGREAHVRELI